MNKDNRYGFMFFCPDDKVGLAREILENFDGAHPEPEWQRVRKTIIKKDCRPDIVTGVYADGLVNPDNRDSLEAVLAQNEIVPVNSVNFLQRPNLSELAQVDPVWRKSK
jgi:hypothetical protein